ncbi:hypothetical protein BD626DRAFT_495504 [Schizophyllum amplum]|uniref:Uncharacterized protein n=1 Tax=Schizophyllum amplum TaxID=97359 RepID=A0A550CE79_9AGAR|nr:hypothetical protein BD626DRAFT_495504 [Auriculariopsis ampla]
MRLELFPVAPVHLVAHLLWDLVRAEISQSLGVAMGGDYARSLFQIGGPVAMYLRWIRIGRRLGAILEWYGLIRRARGPIFRIPRIGESVRLFLNGTAVHGEDFKA